MSDIMNEALAHTTPFFLSVDSVPHNFLFFLNFILFLNFTILY